VPLIDTLLCNELNFSTVAIDANNYFYKFLGTESDVSTQIEEIFCILTSGAHDSMALLLISDHLGRCETASERHLLRCLYIFCYFCHTGLRLRHLLFVIDGAAPVIKTNELAERKQQKRQAYGKVLLERRTLLLHRIYMLRWYQIAAVTLALMENYRGALEDKEHVFAESLSRLLQNSFEWSLGTEIPTDVFAVAMSSLYVGKSTNALCDLFAKLRMTVQTSFLVEIDFANSNFYHLDLCLLFESLIISMMKSDENIDEEKPKPFLLCLHINQAQARQIEHLFSTYRQSVEQCWKNCRSTFLLCTIVHECGHKSIVGIPPDHTAEFFRHWEKESCKYWCNPQVFPHKHQYVWREIQYSEWLCSNKGDEWLRNAYQDGEDRETYYYQVPKRYSQCYDTKNDTSHQTLDWTNAAKNLFTTTTLNGIETTDQLVQRYFPRLGTTTIISSSTVREELQRHSSAVDIIDASDDMQEDIEAPLDHSVDVLLEQKQKHHQRYRIRDEFLQIVVRFLRVVCGAPVVVAEHEAEATCAKLCRDKLCDFVFSDDVDALAFGSPNIVVDWPDICEIGKSLTLMGGTLRPKFSAKIIRVDQLRRHFDLSWEDFTLWCIFCGTDFMHVGESKLSVAMTLRIIKNHSTLQERVDQLERRKYVEKSSLDLVTRVYQFFNENQIMPQSDFLTRQFAPFCVDETLRLNTICASRKLGIESE